MSGARTGGAVKHKKAELCLKAFISILSLQQSVPVYSTPCVKNTHEDNDYIYMPTTVTLYSEFDNNLNFTSHIWFEYTE